MDGQTEKTLIANTWSTILTLAQNHAAAMSRLCTPEAAALIESELQKFLELNAPETQVDLAVRHVQSAEFGARVSAVSNASTTIALHPSVSSQILEAVRHYLGAPYPESARLTTDCFLGQSELSSTISQLCSSDVASRIEE